MRPLRVLKAICAVLALLLPGCGGGGGSPSTASNQNLSASGVPPPAVNVLISPQQARVVTGQSLTFRAEVLGTTDLSVRWSAQRGSITTGGVYTAPDTPGPDTVTVASVPFPTRSATAQITVVPPVRVTITPRTATLTINQTQQFSAVVQNAEDPSVTYQVQEGPEGGSITPSGLYTPPRRRGVFHVIAISNADPSKRDTAEIRVLAGSAGGTVQ
ncbi:MAG: hypothetical protein RMJ43_15385 [Chloroherpetonaceae bacterium]|nr:hypothetical protein [Chthonomonadaceae bacterium]MDW8209217.1 hypothetical protein [Chloroherpetonaceae bacterium]